MSEPDSGGGGDRGGGDIGMIGLSAQYRTPHRSWERWGRYAIAGVLSVLALVGTTLMSPLLGHTPFVFFYVAVALTALYCGLGPALLTSFAGILCVTYFLLLPAHSFRIERPADIMSLAAFAVVSFAASSLTQAQRSARERAEAAVRLVGSQAVDLAQTNEQLRLATVEADRAREAAEEAQAEAERANAAKSQFLATMSHEIRTPINAVVGFAELLADGIGGTLTGVQQDYARRIANSGRHLATLVSDILDLSKVESGRMVLARTPGHLPTVAEDAIGLVRSLAQAKGLELEIQLGDDCANLMYLGDEARVRQILVNLLSNAIKFTAPGGCVTTSCGIGPPPPAVSGRADVSNPERPRLAYVTVADTGCGIPSDQLEAVFEPFVQGETDFIVRTRGTGLGLAISRRLARMMGGDLTVDSTVGVGSTFTLWIPRRRVPREATARADGPRESSSAGSREETVATAL